MCDESRLYQTPGASWQNIQVSRHFTRPRSEQAMHPHNKPRRACIRTNRVVRSALSSAVIPSTPVSQMHDAIVRLFGLDHG
jgi:hypothetical protein